MKKNPFLQEKGRSVGRIGFSHGLKSWADTIGSCPIYKNIRTVMGSWKYKWRNWDQSHHNNRSMREQRGKFSTNWTSPANIMSGNLSLAKKTFLLDEQWVRGEGQAYEMAAERTEYVVYENHIFVYTRTAGQKDMYLDSKQFFSQRGYACNKTRPVC